MSDVQLAAQAVIDAYYATPPDSISEPMADLKSILTGGVTGKKYYQVCLCDHFGSDYVVDPDDIWQCGDCLKAIALCADCGNDLTEAICPYCGVKGQF